MEFWIGFGCGVVCAMFAAFMMCLTLFVVQLIGQKGGYYGGEMDETDEIEESSWRENEEEDFR